MQQNIGSLADLLPSPLASATSSPTARSPATRRKRPARAISESPNRMCGAPQPGSDRLCPCLSPLLRLQQTMKPRHLQMIVRRLARPLLLLLLLVRPPLTPPASSSALPPGCRCVVLGSLGPNSRRLRCLGRSTSRPLPAADRLTQLLAFLPLGCALDVPTGGSIGTGYVSASARARSALAGD